MAPTTLFVIDIQKAMAENAKTEIPHAKRIREAATSILDKARSSIDASRHSGKEPILSIVVVQHEEQPEEGPLVRGAEPWELVFPCRNGDKAERLVSKTHADTFESNPQLAEQLRAEGVERIVAFGIQSEYCVRATSKGALAAGFKVVVLKGAHSTYDEGEETAEEIERNIEGELMAQGANIVAWEDWNP